MSIVRIDSVCIPASVSLTPDMHADLAAAGEGKSLNQWITENLSQSIKHGECC